MNNLGIVFYNRGKKGGAERRYYNLMNTISNYETIYLLSNSSLLNHWGNLGGFKENIVIECLYDDYKSEINSSLIKDVKEKKNNKRNKFDIIKKIIPKSIRANISNFLEILKLNIIVFKWVKKNRITHINTIQASGILVVFVKLLGCKIIFSYVDYMVQNGYPFHWIKNQGLKTVVKISDKYDFLSEMIPDRMLKKGLQLNKDKINIAPISFIDYTKFSIKLPKERVIIFSGRFEEIKNPILALEVAKELAVRKIIFKLKMIGYGSLENDLIKFINKHNLNNFVEILATDNIEKELSDALIFLSLQKENNYPSQALLEAMASGCISIVTDVGETRKIINKENGFLVNEDISEIVEKVEKIFSNQELYENKGVEIRNNTIEIFSISTYLKYYKSLMN